MKKVIDIPQIVKDIAQVLLNNGNQAFVVGGAVRDAVMGVPCKDIDIATDLFVDDVIELLKEQSFTEDIKKTGDKFPVARIFTKSGDEFEIATFRADIGEGKDTGFKVISTIDGDVERRDFTFNALFAKADTGEIVDLVGGIKDLENGIIRFVGDPIKRINEDRTRLLRLARFKEKFGFEVENLDQILSNNVLIEGLDEKDQVKKEMIVEEITKGFHQAKNKISFFKTLIEFGLLEQAFPELKISNPMMNFQNIEMMLIQILWNNDIETLEKVMKDMKWSNDTIDRISIVLKISKFDVHSKSFNIPDLSRMVKKMSAVNIKEVLTDFSTLFLFGEKSKKTKLVKALINFKMTVKNTDFPNIPNGPELGKAIHNKEMSNLLRNAGID